MSPAPAVLDRAAFRRTLRLGVREGIAWAFMVGLGEMFFVADAIRLGADRVFAASVGILPLLAGSLGGILGLALLGRVRWRRPLIVGLVVLQATVLFGLAALDLTGRGSPLAILAAASAYTVLAQAAGPAWSSWMGQIVPARLRGRYFARRNRWVHAASLTGLLAAGIGLRAAESFALAPDVAFAILFSLAGLARLASAALLLAGREPAFVRPGTDGGVRAVVRGRLPTPALRLVRTGGLLWLTVAISSPFFAPFMLIDLGFGYAEYALAEAALVVGKVTSLARMGPVVDRRGPVLPWRLGTGGIALLPLPWMLVGGPLGAAACQLVGGLSWGAFEVTQLALLLGATSDRQRAAVFALHGVVTGVSIALGSVVGSLLLVSGAPLHGVFLASAIGRTLVVGASWKIPVPLPAERDALRVTGLTPQGPTARPVLRPPTPAAASGEMAPPTLQDASRAPKAHTEAP